MPGRSPSGHQPGSTGGGIDSVSVPRNISGMTSPSSTAPRIASTRDPTVVANSTLSTATMRTSTRREQIQLFRYAGRAARATGLQIELRADRIVFIPPVHHPRLASTTIAAPARSPEAQLCNHVPGSLARPNACPQAGVANTPPSSAPSHQPTGDGQSSTCGADIGEQGVSSKRQYNRERARRYREIKAARAAVAALM